MIVKTNHAGRRTETGRRTSPRGIFLIVATNPPYGTICRNSVRALPGALRGRVRVSSFDGWRGIEWSDLRREAAVVYSNPLRIGEVLSPYAQRKKRFIVKSLDHFEKDAEEWTEAIVEDYHTPVFDQIAFRIDFPRWLTLQTKRNRRIAEAMALGHSTSQIAKRFQISPGRISQLRGELYRSWQDFHDDTNTAAA